MNRKIVLMQLGLAMLVCATSAIGQTVSAPKLVKLEGIAAFLEGPAWHSDGNLYFTDIENNRIMRLDSKGKMHQFRSPSGRANGLAFDQEGRLLACEGGWEGGNRRVTRTELDGTITVLADNFEGKKLNSPNDLVVDKKGRIYFSDPRYGFRGDLEQFDAQKKPIDGVYRIDPDKSIHRVIAGQVERPNGLVISPDGKWLFVVDNQNSTAGGNRKVWRFDLRPDGGVVLESQKLLHDFGTGRGGDGIDIDAKGRIYVSAGFNLASPPIETDTVKAGIYVFTHEGKQVDFIPVPADMLTNAAFGGRDLKTLYITAGHSIFSIRVDTPGYVAWPSAR